MVLFHPTKEGHMIIGTESETVEFKESLDEMRAAIVEEEL